MMKNQAILELMHTFDINAIYAHKVFDLADKKKLISDASRIISEKPKPFVKWVGGKRQLLTQFRLLNLYPPENFNPITSKYFEPFVGGGAVFFDLQPEKAMLSDLNTDLITTYTVIKNNVNELISSLKELEMKRDIESFLHIREQNPENLTVVEVASRFIYLNRTCFNGMYRVNSKGKFNVPYGKYSNPTICDEENLRRVSNVLKYVEIIQQDYKEVLKQAQKNDFIYFDPPYYPMSITASFTSYTSMPFLKKEQIELRDIFMELHDRKCFVMLSNSDTPFIHEIYSDFEGIRITKVSAGRAINSNASKRGKITEVVVTNY